MKYILIITTISTIVLGSSFKLPDTGQEVCYDNYKEIECPSVAEAFYGQDANYLTNPMRYRDNGDGTITDLNTNLIWTKAVDSKKLSLKEAEREAKGLKVGGYSDWRVPNIKELYSLMDFSGYTGFNGRDMSSIPSNAKPFIDTEYFDFRYGDTSSGERYIDAQWLTSTKYVSTTMNNMETLFGVNFADGRIKGYGYKKAGTSSDKKKFFVRYVRGGNGYGENSFVDNKDGTITDEATNLVWMKSDSKKPMDWEEALGYCQSLELGGRSDWRLPDAKELQYIVDYSRSPDTTGSAAIDPIFEISTITNEVGVKDYPYFWSSTTHLDGPDPGKSAVYLSFGRALGEMRGRVMDVHGAGAQRSDPKIGSSVFRGPQGDAVRSQNYVRCVSGDAISAKNTSTDRDSTDTTKTIKPTPSKKDSNTHPFILREDKDGDGRVSKDEFGGPKEHFFMFDKNRDGYIEASEAPKGPPPKR